MVSPTSVLSTLVNPFVFGAFSYLLCKALGLKLSRKKSLPYPPGPPPKILVGNAFDVPQVASYKTFANWGKQYNSGIIHIEALGTHVIVINDRKIAEELFEKRSALYNNRPDLPIVPLMGLDYNFTFLNGEEWRPHRRICQQHFNKSAAKKYQPMQLAEVRAFLRGLLNEPDRFVDHYKMLSVALQLSMMYGYQPSSLDDRIIKVADESSAIAASLLLPGASLVNVFPVLRHIPAWFPFASSQKRAKLHKEIIEEVKSLPLEYVKQAFKEGKANPALVTEYLESKANGTDEGETEEVVNNVAWTVYNGGSDTTRATTGTFIHIMAKHPEVQRRAQAEIDRVIGNERLPTFEDRPKLPYIDAIYREVFRYHPIDPMAVPHCLTDDDVYEGYFLPKGAVVIANVWAMAHDEKVYEDTFTFKPERFLTEKGELNDDDRVIAYGFGRRVCVGKEVASANTWLTIVSFLACFNIDKAKDESGNEIEIDDEYDDNGAMIHKKPFTCAITPRSSYIRTLIEADLA